MQHGHIHSTLGLQTTESALLLAERPDAVICPGRLSQPWTLPTLSGPCDRCRTSTIALPSGPRTSMTPCHTGGHVVLIASSPHHNSLLRDHKNSPFSQALLLGKALAQHVKSRVVRHAACAASWAGMAVLDSSCVPRQRRRIGGPAGAVSHVDRKIEGKRGR